jgi:hypothetical protein
MWGRDNVEANKRTGRREGQSLAGAECGGYEGSKGHDEVAGQVRTEWTGREDEEKLKLEEREEAEGPGGAAFFFGWFVGGQRGIGGDWGSGAAMVTTSSVKRRGPGESLCRSAVCRRTGLYSGYSHKRTRSTTPYTADPHTASAQ